MTSKVAGGKAFLPFLYEKAQNVDKKQPNF